MRRGSPMNKRQGRWVWLMALAAAWVGLAGAACTRAPLPPPAPPPAVLREPEPPPRPPEPPEAQEIDSPRFARVTAAAREEVAAAHVPGAVILVGHQGEIVYRRAFGHRSLTPAPQPMTVDTVFDLASLTKSVATTTAVMQLVDQGRLKLDAPAARSWPAFGANGKGGITLRQLLTHTSGLRAEVSAKGGWQGYEGALAAIVADRPVTPPGTAFRYSDVNFIVLGEIVRRVSGKSLDLYCAQQIFRPLGLKHTGFLPPPGQKSRTAPSDLRWGEVHDPTAYRMGGVAGHAGVFGTAGDLAVFAQMLLDGGVWRGQRLLSPAAVAALSKPNRLPGSATRRGLGWDLVSPYSKEHTAAFPPGSFGHTGFTGTSLWLDPKSKTFLIILTNRLHPDGKGQVKPLRAKVALAVAQALALGRPASAGAGGPSPVMAGHGQAEPATVRPGIDVLADTGFAALKGKKIGVITNHTGQDAAGRATLARLMKAPGVKVAAIFSPEHGLSGALDEKVASGRDPATGLPVYSLYGEVKKPTPAMLKGLDALVYDIQDVGTRFYTYITTLAYCLEAAAAQGLEVYVLDRPNPLTAAVVQGPVLDPGLKSFIGYFPVPVRYGMTVGELAGMFNREAHLGARLKVVRMEGYRREQWLDDTGLRWVNPSPNLRSLTQAVLYPGVGLVEAANVSVGRGTPMPFEVVGAPWISGPELAGYLRRRNLSGVTFEPVTFTPRASRYQGSPCQGVRLKVTARDELDTPALGVELAAALYRLYPRHFQLDKTLYMVGSAEVLRAVKNGEDPQSIRRRWQPGLERFQRLRARHLLY